MLGAEHASPGLAKQGVAPLDPERTQQRIEFVQEQIDSPEVRSLFRQPRRIAISELVVVYHGPAIESRDVLEGVDIVVAAAWSPMGDNQGEPRRIQVAGDAVPSAVAAKRDMAFLRFHHGGSPRCGKHHRAGLPEGQL